MTTAITPILRHLHISMPNYLLNKLLLDTSASYRLFHEAVEFTLTHAGNPTAYADTDFHPPFVEGYLLLLTDEQIEQLIRDSGTALQVDVLDESGTAVGQIRVDGLETGRLRTVAGDLQVTAGLLPELRKGDIFALSARDTDGRWALYRALEHADRDGKVRIEFLIPGQSDADRKAIQKEKPEFDLGSNAVAFLVLRRDLALKALGREDISEY
jgi:hypothetical protein